MASCDRGGTAQPILRTDRLLLVPLADRHLDLEVDLDSDPEVLRYISGRAHSAGEVAGDHAQRMDLARRAAFGQKHDGLPSRIPRADDRDIRAVIKVGFHRRAGVVDARAQKAVGPLGFQSPPADSQREQDNAALDLRAAIQMQDVTLIGALRRSQPFNGNGRDDPCAELEHL